MIDYLIVGAGFAGAVMARLLADTGKRILLLEKRRHIGGNCYDYYDDHGILVHKYGPHLFHTSNREVMDFLGRFTQWLEYEHRVLAVVDGRKIPLPFNLNSLRRLFPEEMVASLTKQLIDSFGFGDKVPILNLREHPDPELKKLAQYIYDKVFINYTVKQWGCGPEDISAEVTGRVPVFISRDDRYFQDTYQVVPKFGYTRLFENLLDHPTIHLLLNTDYRHVLTVNFVDNQVELFGRPFSGGVIFTGMIDGLFDHCFGRLPYRSIQFEFDHLQQEYFQEASVVNYPNNNAFTRITEFKRISSQRTSTTTILREYPSDYDPDDKTKNTPCYPVFKAENRQLYEQYEQLAAKFSAITLVGRLAEYRYYDMDDIVARALSVFKEKFAC